MPCTGTWDSGRAELALSPLKESSGLAFLALVPRSVMQPDLAVSVQQNFEASQCFLCCLESVILQLVLNDESIYSLQLAEKAGERVCVTQAGQRTSDPSLLLTCCRASTRWQVYTMETISAMFAMPWEEPA